MKQFPLIFSSVCENLRVDAMTKMMLVDMASKMLEWKEHEHEVNDQAMLGD